jgi:hypothetical protein
MALAFGSGVLKYANGSDLEVQEITLDISEEEIPLYGSKQYPIATASGKGSVKGTFKVPSYQSTLLATITNATMAAKTSEVSLVWEVDDTAGTTHTFTLPNVTLTSKKIAGGNDKWLMMDVSFSASAAASGGNVLTIASA